MSTLKPYMFHYQIPHRILITWDNKATWILQRILRKLTVVWGSFSLGTLHKQNCIFFLLFFWPVKQLLWWQRKISYDVTLMYVFSSNHNGCTPVSHQTQAPMVKFQSVLISEDILVAAKNLVVEFGLFTCSEMTHSYTRWWISRFISKYRASVKDTCFMMQHKTSILNKYLHTKQRLLNHPQMKNYKWTTLGVTQEKSLLD